MKILLVDDHSLITDALKVLLLDLDPQAQIFTAADAPGAEQLAAQHQDADLMLLDLGLPGATGTSLLEKLTGMYPDLKILVLSGYC